MAVTNVSLANSQDAVAATSAKNQITRDDFLKLLIAQLQNQDPLSPMDNQQFAAQLATFNSLDQLIGVNEKLDSLQNKQALTSQFNSASLIGKEVTASGDQLILGDSGSASAHYQLAGNATKVIVGVFDNNRQLVRQLEVGNQQAGERVVNWDGRNQSGQRLSPGVYTFEVVALDEAGNAIATAEEVRGVVTGLNLEGTEPMLEIGQLRVPLSTVTAVR